MEGEDGEGGRKRLRGEGEIVASSCGFPSGFGAAFSDESAATLCCCALVQEGHLLPPAAPAGLTLPGFALKGNIIILQGHANAAAGALHQYLQHFAGGDFLLTSPKWQKEKTRHFSIFCISYQGTFPSQPWGAHSSFGSVGAHLTTAFIPAMLGPRPTWSMADDRTTKKEHLLGLLQLSCVFPSPEKTDKKYSFSIMLITFRPLASLPASFW